MSNRYLYQKLKLEKEIKDYGNGMFLTVAYPRTTGYLDKLGRYRHREEWYFRLVLRDKQYKREKSFIFETRYQSRDLFKEFKLSEVAKCREYWFKMRNAELPAPEWKEW
jgi:hypothetical protein